MGLAEVKGFATGIVSKAADFYVNTSIGLKGI